MTKLTIIAWFTSTVGVDLLFSGSGSGPPTIKVHVLTSIELCHTQKKKNKKLKVKIKKWQTKNEKRKIKNKKQKTKNEKQKIKN